MKYFNITRIFADAYGESHFMDVKIPLEDKGEIGYLSSLQEAVGVVFRKVDPGYDYGFHTAPNRQYILLLDGLIEIETSLGQKRTFGSGATLLVEDTEGKGHKTRNIKKAERASIFILLK